MSDKKEEVKTEENENKEYLNETVLRQEPMTYHGPISFSEMQSEREAREAAFKVEEMASEFPIMVGRIFHREDIEDKDAALQTLADEFISFSQDALANKEKWQPLTDKATNLIADLTKAETKMEDGVSYPAKDFAYVPDAEKPSTWKLRLAEGKPGNITKAQLGRAAAAFSSGGFRGNKVRLPSSDVAKVKARIKNEYKKLGVKQDELPDSLKEQDSFNIWYDKERNQWRWLAIFSNNYRDQDNPPEIISSDSHKNFVKSVESGNVPYPELWLWHVPGSRFGQSDWLTYTDEGFAIASGYIDEGKEYIAKGLSEYPDQLLTSHGMPKPFIERNEKDKTIITKHITREISPLPAQAAANKLTSFELLSKEGSEQMAIPDNKKEFLKQVGMSDEEIAQIETSVKDKATQAEDAGLEKKEEEIPLNADAIVKAMSTMLTPFIERLDAMDATIKELQQTDDNKVKQKLTSIPKNSLEYLAQQQVESLFSKDNQVDGRSKLAKSGPKEAKTKEQEDGLFFMNWLQPAEMEESREQ